MKSSEMLKITVQNQASIENLLKACEAKAKQGCCELIHFGYLSTDRISELANLGYRIEKTVTSIQDTIYRISWA